MHVGMRLDVCARACVPVCLCAFVFVCVCVRVRAHVPGHVRGNDVCVFGHDASSHTCMEAEEGVLVRACTSACMSVRVSVPGG